MYSRCLRTDRTGHAVAFPCPTHLSDVDACEEARHAVASTCHTLVTYVYLKYEIMYFVKVTLKLKWKQNSTSTKLRQHYSAVQKFCAQCFIFCCVLHITALKKIVEALTELRTNA